jgi:hypothetical protein
MHCLSQKAPFLPKFVAKICTEHRYIDPWVNHIFGDFDLFGKSLPIFFKVNFMIIYSNFVAVIF